MNLVSHRLTCSAAGPAVRRAAPHAVMAAWLVLVALIAIPGPSVAATPPAPSPDPAPARSGPQPDAAPVRAAPALKRTTPSVAASPTSDAPAPSPTTAPVTSPAPVTTTPPAATRRKRTAATPRRSNRARSRRGATRTVPSLSAGIVPPRVLTLTHTAQHDTGALMRGGFALLALALAGAALLDLSLRTRRAAARG